MLQPLKSVNDYDYIVKTAEERKIQLTMIGYLDEPFMNMGTGDLLLHISSVNSLHGIDKYIIKEFKTFLESNSVSVVQFGTRLMVFDEVVYKSSYEWNKRRGSCLILVKIVNGLNNYSVAGYEAYKQLLESVDKFLRLTGEKGDY